MASLKEIRRRITSVKNTKQITRAMKLVSAAKLRRAQEAALGGRNFSERIKEVLQMVQSNLPEDFSHPLLEERSEVKTRRVIIIAGERGLCGAYNTNVFKEVEKSEFSDSQSGVKLEVVAIGRRTVAYARSRNWNLVGDFEGLPEDAGSWPIVEIVEQQVADFLNGDCDEIALYYTEFVSVINQEIRSERILPFVVEGLDVGVEQSVEALPQADSPSKSEEASDGNSVGSSAKFSPSPTEIVARMIPLLINTRLTQAALDAKASEHASRMTAMDAATRNADELIDNLRLFYNRARQSAITTELIDIVGGAEAQQ